MLSSETKVLVVIICVVHLFFALWMIEQTIESSRERTTLYGVYIRTRGNLHASHSVYTRYHEMKRSQHKTSYTVRPFLCA